MLFYLAQGIAVVRYLTTKRTKGHMFPLTWPEDDVMLWCILDQPALSFANAWPCARACCYDATEDCPASHELTLHKPYLASLCRSVKRMRLETSTLRLALT